MSPIRRGSGGVLGTPKSSVVVSAAFGSSGRFHGTSSGNPMGNGWEMDGKWMANALMKTGSLNFVGWVKWTTKKYSSTTERGFLIPREILQRDFPKTPSPCVMIHHDIQLARSFNPLKKYRSRFGSSHVGLNMMIYIHMLICIYVYIVIRTMIVTFLVVIQYKYSLVYLYIHIKKKHILI